jgi:hypothetical protein
MQDQSLLATVKTYHRYLEELFWLHQEALLERDLPLAMDFWALHQQMLLSHINVENTHLIAAHERCVHEPQWRSRVYLLEHEKIQAISIKMVQRLEGRASGRLSRREVIQLIDSQRSLKNVLEHHEDREESGLLPELEQVLAGSEQRLLADTCETVWAAVLSAQALPLLALRSRLSAVDGRMDRHLTRPDRV